MSLKQNTSTKYGTRGSRKDSRSFHKVLFNRTASGREPVREWLKQIDPANRKRIGEDLYTRIMNLDNKHVGSSLDEFLAEEGLLESSQYVAIKRVLSWQLTQFMKKQNLSKAAMAGRMNTSRSALDRLLDPDNESVTLNTLQNAARAIGAHLEMKLVFEDRVA